MIARFAPLIGIALALVLYSIPNILVSTTFDISTIPEAVFDVAEALFFWGNVAVQGAAPIVGVMAGIERHRLIQRAGGTPSTDTPEIPAPHTSAYALGKVALILSAALPFMLTGAMTVLAFSQKQYCDAYGWKACQQSGAGLAGLILILLFGPGAALLTRIVYSYGRDLLEPAGLRHRPVQRAPRSTVIVFVAALVALGYAAERGYRIVFLAILVVVVRGAVEIFAKRRRS